jgi:hypothetical protein
MATTFQVQGWSTQPPGAFPAISEVLFGVRVQRAHTVPRLYSRIVLNWPK